MTGSQTTTGNQAIRATTKSKSSAIWCYLVSVLLWPALTAILAWSLGLPEPIVHDEFSYLFMADTFALGRIANTEHPLAEFFQAFHILHCDGIYASKYFPGLGLQLLLGKVLGHPIIGVWLTIALLGLSLQFFLSRSFGHRIAVVVTSICSLQYVVLSYFGHSYWGGSLMALAGVLIFGGAIGAIHFQRASYSWLSAIGLGIAILTRPFETVFCVVPAAALLTWILLRGDTMPRGKWKLALPYVVVVSIAIPVIGAFNQTISGSWSTFTHTYYERKYTPHGVRFVWEKQSESLQQSFTESLPSSFFMMRNEYFSQHRQRTESFWKMKLEAASQGISFQFPWTIYWMIVASFLFRSHWRNWIWRLCAITLLMRLAPLMLSWSARNPHYGALWTFPVAVLCAFGLQSLLAFPRTRTLAWTGACLSITTLIGIYLLSFNPSRDLAWKDWTSYRMHELKLKAAVEAFVTKNATSQHVILVRYRNDHSFLDEWVYNSPQIDAQQIIWAHDLGLERNKRLIDYYRQRSIWLVETGATGTKVQKWNAVDRQFEYVTEFQLMTN